MKLWGGRFTKETDELVEDFHSSISFDQRLYKEDILGSIAHAEMLGKQGIISESEAKVLVEGLQKVLADIEAGRVEFEVGAEDIHMNIEKILTEKVGSVGKKLHTARSRNDQVALDIRMYLKKEILAIGKLLNDLLEILAVGADKYQDAVMPGYTHLQKAQPITLAHHYMAYFQMFARDFSRLQDVFKRTDVMPLGSGALAGTTFDLDREFVAQQLNFEQVTENSLDGVSDRDFAVEFMGAASILMMHLSRFAEEIVLWSSNEFNFVVLDDAYSTGSSIMPQKKNPDVAELVRGKTGRVYGDLIALLTVMKGLPLAYNKDMQEDKETLFDAVDTVKKSLLVFAPMLATMKINKEQMREGSQKGFINATDVADYLAAHGVPFREAHAIVGNLVLYCENQKKSIDELSLDEFQVLSEVFEEDIYENITLERCVDGRKVIGGPGREAAEKALQKAKKTIEDQQSWLQEKK